MQIEMKSMQIESTDMDAGFICKLYPAAAI